MIVSGWAWSVAAAGPAALLAPGPEELASAEEELERRLETAEAVGTAVARLQSAWIATRPTCDDTDGAALTVRFRHFASAWHDTVQRVRVQADRLARLEVAPTLLPIVDAERRASVDGRMARADGLEQGWLELVGWTMRVGLPVCAATLAPAPGLPRPTLAAESERPSPVAITAVGGGLLCGGDDQDVPAIGVVTLVRGPVCWAAGPECSCVPEPVDPGAVLGPPPDALLSAGEGG